MSDQLLQSFNQTLKWEKEFEVSDQIAMPMSEVLDFT